MYIYIQCYRIDSFEPLKIKWRGYVVAFYEPSLGFEYDPNVNFSKGSNFDENYIYMYSAMAFCGHNLCWKIAISSCLFSSTFICRGKNDYTGWLYSKQIWNLLTAVVCCVTIWRVLYNAAKAHARLGVLARQDPWWPVWIQFQRWKASRIHPWAVLVLLVPKGAGAPRCWKGLCPWASSWTGWQSRWAPHSEVAGRFPPSCATPNQLPNLHVSGCLPLSLAPLSQGDRWHTFFLEHSSSVSTHHAITCWSQWW